MSLVARRVSRRMSSVPLPRRMSLVGKRGAAQRKGTEVKAAQLQPQPCPLAPSPSSNP